MWLVEEHHQHPTLHFGTEIFHGSLPKIYLGMKQDLLNVVKDISLKKGLENLLHKCCRQAQYCLVLVPLWVMSQLLKIHYVRIRDSKVSFPNQRPQAMSSFTICSNRIEVF